MFCEMKTISDSRRYYRKYNRIWSENNTTYHYHSAMIFGLQIISKFSFQLTKGSLKWTTACTNTSFINLTWNENSFKTLNDFRSFLARIYNIYNNFLHHTFTLNSRALVSLKIWGCSENTRLHTYHRRTRIHNHAPVTWPLIWPLYRLQM